ncbi:hypothetical protein [Hyphomicrobium sp.]|uniref:hypothetical protein n=1 Tax=Hyphomicrobium sp. TaxID=82 RepID=UPI0025BB058A|nr:hypothetical protein [Hyphomicrobium sp.]MCC7251609.1 hypothetical protein [Hyphomicrobium sp.]
MAREPTDIDPDHVVVLYALLGRNEAAEAELLRRFDNAPFWQQRTLRQRLAQAIELFADARDRHDRMGIYRR